MKHKKDLCKCFSHKKLERTFEGNGLIYFVCKICDRQRVDCLNKYEDINSDGLFPFPAIESDYYVLKNTIPLVSSHAPFGGIR